MPALDFFCSPFQVFQRAPNLVWLKSEDGGVSMKTFIKKVMSYVVLLGLQEAIKPINLLVNYLMMKYKITAMKC